MKFATGLAAVMALALCGAARAQSPATPVSLSLAYDGSLYIKVLDIHFDEQATPTGFGASASLRSYGILAAFKTFNIKASSHGRIEAGAPRPGVFLYDNRDGERDRKVRVSWREGEVTAVSTPPYGGLGHPPATLEQKLSSADPLTQLLRITLAQTPGDVCTGAPRFFDGKQLYALEFDHGQTIALTDAQRALGLTSAVRCAVTYREIAGFKAKSPKKPEPGLKSRISAVFGQFGQDGPWAMIKVTASTGLGPAVIELKRAKVTHEAHLAED
jgi:hypothetical protein